MVKIGFIVEGDSDKIICESDNFKKLLTELNLINVGIVTPGGRPNFFSEEQLMKHCREIKNKGAKKIVVIIDKETDEECITQIKNKIHVRNVHG